MSAPPSDIKCKEEFANTPCQTTKLGHSEAANLNLDKTGFFRNIGIITAMLSSLHCYGCVLKSLP